LTDQPSDCKTKHGSSRIDIRKVLADPHLRREMKMPLIQAIQGREGIDTSREQAEHAYDKVTKEKQAQEGEGKAWRV